MSGKESTEAITDPGTTGSMEPVVRAAMCSDTNAKSTAFPGENVLYHPNREGTLGQSDSWSACFCGVSFCFCGMFLNYGSTSAMRLARSFFPIRMVQYTFAKECGRCYELIL